MAGAPKANIDWNRVSDLLVAGCSGAEIAGHIGLNKATIYERCVTDNGLTFSEYSQQKYAKGESLLRAKQFEKAVKGDNMMLIWLGKNRLDQKDHKESKNDTNDKKLDELIQGIKSKDEPQS